MLAAQEADAGLRRALLGDPPPLPLPHRQPPRAAVPRPRKRSGTCRGRSMRSRCIGAAQRLVGTHDFTSFRSTECQAKSPVRTLDGSTSSARGDELVIEATARSFLHNQVRSMVGSLKLVGEGKWSAGRSRGGARGPRPHRLRAGRPARRALSGAGRLSVARMRAAGYARSNTTRWQADQAVEDHDRKRHAPPRRRAPCGR